MIWPFRVADRFGEYFNVRRFCNLQKQMAVSVQPCYRQVLDAADWVLASDQEHRTEKNWIVYRGTELRGELMKQYHQKFSGVTPHRILIHLPSEAISPAGYSWFNSFAEALSYVGVPVRTLSWDDNSGKVFDSFKPTIFLTSDAVDYLSRLDWPFIAQYRAKYLCSLGLTASLQEYGNSPLWERLDWARRHRVSFYYSFRPAEYLQTRREYQPFYDEGYRILTLEFAANPIHHYPVSSSRKLADYVFLGSSNPDKWPRYCEFFHGIIKKYNGFVAGPGWPFANGYIMNAARDRFVYSLARIGLNLSINEQIQWPCELNERTYILAACGIPQLLDNPALLPARFSAGSVFSADSGRAYCRLFENMLADPGECEARAVRALEEVFAQHTLFHRIDSFLQQLQLLESSTG